MNFLQAFINFALPYLICLLEIIGIFVIVLASLVEFFHYLQNMFLKKQRDVLTRFSKALAVGLEFEIAAEILKTILIQSLDEIYILGGIILLRIALSLLIHFETRPPKKQKDEEIKK